MTDCCASAVRSSLLPLAAACLTSLSACGGAAPEGRGQDRAASEASAHGGGREGLPRDCPGVCKGWGGPPNGLNCWPVPFLPTFCLIAGVRCCSLFTISATAARTVSPLLPAMPTTSSSRYTAARDAGTGRQACGAAGGRLPAPPSNGHLPAGSVSPLHNAAHYGFLASGLLLAQRRPAPGAGSSLLLVASSTLSLICTTPTNRLMFFIAAGPRGPPPPPWLQPRGFGKKSVGYVIRAVGGVSGEAP